MSDLLNDKSKVFIVLQPYSYNPEESFSRAVKIVKKFREEGKVVFSPILHTHGYHVALRELLADHDDDYYGWDLKVYEAMKDNCIMAFTKDWETSKGCRLEMKWARLHCVPIVFINEV